MGGSRASIGATLSCLSTSLCCWRRVCLVLSTSMGCWFLAALTRIRNWSWSQHLISDSCVNSVLTCGKIGAAPLTRKCLGDSQVRKSIDMDKEYALLVNAVQEANEYTVYALTEGGYNGLMLQSLVLIWPVERRMMTITERMSKEWVELLATANTHG